MHVLRHWRRGIAVSRHSSISHLSFEQCQTRFDVHVGWIKLGGSGVCVERITCLVIARLVLFDVSFMREERDS
jgi:hypothetical protein